MHEHTVKAMALLHCGSLGVNGRVAEASQCAMIGAGHFTG